MIQESKELNLKNILSLRKKLTQQQLQEELVKIGQFLKDSGAKKDGSLMTATFSVENIDGQQIMDVEVLVPIDKKIEVTGEYKFKPIFHLVNALCIRHEGNPAKISNTISELNEYIIKNNLQVITATYNVTIKDAKTQEELDDVIIDIYVGINPSIL